MLTATLAQVQAALLCNFDTAVRRLCICAHCSCTCNSCTQYAWLAYASTMLESFVSKLRSYECRRLLCRQQLSLVISCRITQDFQIAWPLCFSSTGLHVVFWSRQDLQAATPRTLWWDVAPHREEATSSLMHMAGPETRSYASKYIFC